MFRTTLHLHLLQAGCQLANGTGWNNRFAGMPQTPFVSFFLQITPVAGSTWDAAFIIASTKTKRLKIEKPKKETKKKRKRKEKKKVAEVLRSEWVHHYHSCLSRMVIHCSELYFYCPFLGPE